MKIAVLSALILLPTLASAEIVCNAKYIKEWPLNPYVTVTELESGKYEVLVLRSYYGYGTGGPFTAKMKTDKAGNMIFKGSKDQLIIGADGEGTLITKEYGEELLTCSGGN